MKELIKIQSKNGNKTVSAKELHEFLGIKRHLTQWLEPYIKENNDYGFIESIDFARINVEVNPTNGIPVIDYEITLEMSKELSMLSKSEKGKEARKYFIGCEKELKTNQLQIPTNDISKQIAEIVQAEVQTEIQRINTTCSQYYKPTATDKFNASKYIKTRLGIVRANDEYEAVKQRLFFIWGVRKWEDVPIETLKNSLAIIDESIRVIKADRPQQMSLI